MKIIFLNTWHATLRAELRSYIEQNLQDTTIFCFQEADSASRVKYEDLLSPHFTVYETKRLEQDGHWFTNAMYIRHATEVIEKGELFVEQPEGFHLGLAHFATIIHEGKPITVCNVHGISQPGDKLDSPARLYQTDALIKAFEINNAVVIGGDFNLLPESKSVQDFAEHGYRNLIVDYDVKTTRNEYAFERYPNNIQYYADYAFVSPAVTVKEFIIPEEIASDHQPLELTIS